MKFTLLASLALVAFVSASPLEIRQDGPDSLCGVDSVATFPTEAECTASCTAEFQDCYNHPNGNFECCGPSSCFVTAPPSGPDAEQQCNDLCPGPCYNDGEIEDRWACRHCEPLVIPTGFPVA